MELANKILSTLMGQSFTPESASTSALAINFLHKLKKDVEDEIRGRFFVTLTTEFWTINLDYFNSRQLKFMEFTKSISQFVTQQGSAEKKTIRSEVKECMTS